MAGKRKLSVLSALSGMPDSSDVHEMLRIALEKHEVLGVGFGVNQSGTTLLPGPPVVRVYRQGRDIEPVERHLETNCSVKACVLVAEQHRPLSQAGAEIQSGEASPGTLGCFVRECRRPYSIYLLSNRHVLGEPRADVIDVQQNVKIAIVERVFPYAIGKLNLADAAIALLDAQTGIKPEIPGLGHVKDYSSKIGTWQCVAKVGKATGHTVGIITDISATISLPAGDMLTIMHDQIGISDTGSPFSDSGDSGSLVTDGATGKAIALLFARDATTMSWATPIDRILHELAVELM